MEGVGPTARSAADGHGGRVVRVCLAILRVADLLIGLLPHVALLGSGLQDRCRVLPCWSRVCLCWLGCGCGFELLVDLAGAFAGGGEFGGLGERLAEAGVGVLDLAAGVVDVGQRLGFGRFELGEAVFQAGDQADRVGVGEVSRGEADLGAGGAFQGGVALDLAEVRVMVTVRGKPPSSPVRRVRWREPSWFAVSWRRMWSRCRPASIRLR